ncbi:MAG: peptide deformylase [Nitrospira sp.]|nr:peptide deformylase [bacterium]MBL7049387.1 peptide deformylase [Nitrospira sp.]
MSLLEIRKFPDIILKEKTQAVSVFDDELQVLVDDMIETMYAAPGIGLAANQIGVPRQIAVIDVGAGDGESNLIVLVNPKIVCKDGVCDSEEGCLSIPEYTTILKRAEKVTVNYHDRGGNEMQIEADGLMARALQHEIDHLNGVLIVDRIGRIKREFFKKRYTRSLADS